MPIQIILDTDILIDFSRNNKNAVQTLKLLEQDYGIGISVITAMELYTGCRSKLDLKKDDEFIKNLDINFVNEGISGKAFEWMKEFRASHGMEINDMLIAATAYSLDFEFISKNQKHYKFLPGLKLLNYPLY